MPRLNEAQWEAMRDQWEADPEATFESLAAEAGVSHTAVSKHAKRAGWCRTTCTPEIARGAHLKADSRELQVRADLTPSVPMTDEQKREMAESVRADVIERQRADWVEHRRLFRVEDIASNFELGKSAKITAEMIAIRQKAEREAYGFGDPSQAPAPKFDWAALGPDWTALIPTPIPPAPDWTALCPPELKHTL